MKTRDWILLVCFLIVLVGAITTAAVVLGSQAGHCTPNYSCKPKPPPP
ncbi:MAG TPA: hypothetical protein VHX88_16900 [Solirubrobacteraceae bacterium]|nr:hypothetical protein [Solirubrobacteraceae bacterium]